MIIKHFIKNVMKISTIFSMFLIIGCSKDKDNPLPDAPIVVIKASNQTVIDKEVVVNIAKDSTYKVNVAVSAPGVIKKMDISIDGVVETVTAANQKQDFSKELTINIPFEEKTYTVQVDVTDENNKTSRSSILVKVGLILPPAHPLTAVQLITMGGPTSANNFSAKC